VFPSLTIQENLEMGMFQKPKGVKERLEYVTEIFPELRQAPRPAGRLAVRR
jgi:branched-chain amino acid transport system ATP-binding protein